MKKLIAILLCLSQNCWGYSWWYGQGTATDTTAATAAQVTTATTNGQNSAIVCAIAWESAITSPAMQWNQVGTNQQFTLITTYLNSNSQRVSLYGLVGLNPVGNFTARATWTTSTEAIMQCATFTGVNQTGGATSFPHSTTANGSSLSPAITITSAITDVVMCAFVAGNNATSLTPGPISLYSTVGSGAIVSGGSWYPGASSVTITGAISPTDVWGEVGTDIAAAPGNTVAVSGVSPVFSTQGGKISITGGKVVAL
jgi:hypothetical protein